MHSNAPSGSQTLLPDAVLYGIIVVEKLFLGESDDHPRQTKARRRPARWETLVPASLTPIFCKI